MSGKGMNNNNQQNIFAELSIFRGTNKAKPQFETFNVPFQQGASILDALIWINDNVDESLSFRYSCINANACKECMMVIDGQVEYACVKKLEKHGSRLEPLPNKTLIKDLVTDIVPPKEKLIV
jgi:succinate dehydrogenase/fumarate reductase-like Fe-S protein